MIRQIYKYLIKEIRLINFKKRWRIKNRHNFTTVENIFPLEKVEVGNMTYGKLNIRSYGNDNELLKIGSYCSIAGEVKFLLGGEHSYKTLSTFPINKYILNVKENTITKGPIIIEDDVWIGERTTILSGVRVGQGAIIGAGSVVSRDIPPYAIFAGNSIIKYRFDEKLREKLNEVNYIHLSKDIVLQNSSLFLNELNGNELDKIISLINIDEMRRQDE